MLRLVDPPLDPSGQQARDWLERELVKPEYQDANVIERLLTWLQRVLSDGLVAAQAAPALSVLAGMVVLVVVVILVGWLIGRTTVAPRSRLPAAPVLDQTRASAAQLRSRAETALADGRYEDAIVDAFRALTTRQIERGRLDDRPGATSQEVAGALDLAYPERRRQVDGAARVFDAVRYGDRPGTVDQVRSVLTLDDDLASRS